MTILMACDPGPHTGVALKIDYHYATATLEGKTVGTQLWDMIRDNHPDRLAFEAFATNNRVDVNMIQTIELVGSIRGACSVLGIRAYRHTPQMRYSFIPDAQKLLKQLGMRGYTVHEVDALSHLLLLEWRIKEGKIE